MKKILAIVLIAAAALSATPEVVARASITELGLGLYEYNFMFENTGDVDIDELTIWFDFDFDDATITTDDSQGWNELVMPRDEFTGLGTGYDILAEVDSLAPGTDMSGFSLTINYAGDPLSMMPVCQIIDTGTYETLYETVVVPEPATLALLGAAGLFLRKRS